MDDEEKEQERLEKFLKWANELGITDSPVPNLCNSQTPSSSCLGQSLKISHFPDSGGRGLAAARDLKKHELILRVPKSALMSTQSLTEKDQKLASCVARHTHLSSTQVLSVCLLAEMSKGKNSWWYPYLTQLPRHYDTLASFTPFETEALQVKDAVWAAEKAVSNTETDWKEAFPLMKELDLKAQLLSFRSWLWASATISSRTMYVPWDDVGCLCPVGDFFNYVAPEEESFYSEDLGSGTRVSSFQVNSSRCDEDVQNEKADVEKFDEHSEWLTDAGYKEDLEAYCFYARKCYGIGEQVLLSYGTYTNLELLELYGFLLNANPNEKAFIQLSAEIDTNSWPKESMYIQQDGKPSFALVSALRLWATPQSQRKSVSRLAYSGLQLSAENEICVMKLVKNRCGNLLRRLPTSLEEDVLLLNFVEKMHNWSSVHEVDKMLLGACGGEVDAFIEANDSQKGCNGSEYLFSKKVRRSIERWKLAIQYRIRYKQILFDCVSYCTQTIDVV